MKCVKLKNPDHGSYILSMGEVGNIINELQESEVGSTFILEVIEMSKEEYDNLPEFSGW